MIILMFEKISLDNMYTNLDFRHIIIIILTL